MIQAKITFIRQGIDVNDASVGISQSAFIAMQQWLKGADGLDGAQIIEVANEAEAIERSKNDTKNFYVWAS